MILVDKILFLRHVPLFSGMSLHQLGYFAGIAEEEVYSAGDLIIEEGKHGESMFLIVDGDVRIHFGDKELAIFSKKNYFGELSVIDGEPRSASASAITDCLLLKISKDDFHEILSMHFDSALAVIQALTRDLRQARRHDT